MYISRTWQCEARPAAHCKVAAQPNTRPHIAASSTLGRYGTLKCKELEELGRGHGSINSAAREPRPRSFNKSKVESVKVTEVTSAKGKRIRILALRASSIMPSPGHTQLLVHI